MFELDEWERRWRARLPEALPETVVESSFGAMAALGLRDDDALALLLEVFTDLHRGSTSTPVGPPSRWLPELEPSQGKEALVEAGLLVDLGEAVATVALHRREMSIRRRLDARLERPVDADTRVRLLAEVEALEDRDELGSDQRAALEAAAKEATLAIVGGPGTGKTWLTARLVRAWRAAGIPTSRIACLAPTGKAAQRLGEALADLPIPAPQTLHRMLGFDSDPAGPAPAPLDLSAVLVDEASMLDLHMMDRLLERADPERLVLVGDPQQLPSVAAGAPFRDLVASRPAQVARLSTGRRQNDRLSRFARAVAEGTAEPEAWPASSELPPAEATGVFFLPWGPKLLPVWAAERLQAHGHQVLTVLKEGPRGAAAANQQLGSWRRAAQPQRLHPEGQPLMVIRNDYGRALFNGDIGRVEDGQLVFRRQDELRRFPIGSLQTTPADAMTVHKAQGSEFDAILLLLPDRHHPLVDRSLLYTAVTRARRQVVIAGPRAVWRAGLATARTRTTT